MRAVIVSLVNGDIVVKFPLSQPKQVSPKIAESANFKKHHEIKRNIGKVHIESQLKTTQRGMSPKPFPYLFVLFRLGEPTDEYYIADRRGRKVENPVGRPLRSGDRLVWKPTKEAIQAIVEALAALSEQHKVMRGTASLRSQ